MIAVKCCRLPDSQPKMSFSHVRVPTSRLPTNPTSSCSCRDESSHVMLARLQRFAFTSSSTSCCVASIVIIKSMLL